MASYKNQLSILPFYSSTDYWHSNKSYAYGKYYPLISLGRFLVPFQIITTNSPVTDPPTVNIIRLSDGASQNITTDIDAKGLTTYNFTGYSVYVWDAATELADISDGGGGSWFKNGKYYLTVNDGTDTYYSEVFNITENNGKLTKITYWHNSNLEYPDYQIVYQNSFKYYVYFQTEVGKPEYQFEEIAENRDGYKFVQYSISKKVFKFEFIAPEFLLDAMRVIRMHDNIEIEFDGITYTVDDFIITPEWQEQGDLAVVECQFECDTVITETGNTV